MGAAGEGDVRVLAVLSAGDDGQAGSHGAALGHMVGDRVAEFGIFIRCVQEPLVRPAAPPRLGVRVEGAAHQQAVRGDLLDAEQVTVGQGAAGLAGLDGVVVAGAGNQVAAADAGTVRDARDRVRVDAAEADEVVADPAGELPAQAVVGGHQQHVGALKRQGGVGGRGGVEHLLRVAALDPRVLVVLGQDGAVAVTQPQAGGLFPGGVEPPRLG
jgi:hypothetical protein